MKELKEIIEKIVQFGNTPKLEIDDKIYVLKKLLINLYYYFINLKLTCEEKEYDEEPDFNYNLIRENVSSNFPAFGFYNKVLYPNEIEPEIGLEDEIDDLTDIIIDLLKVKWRFENTSEQDALYYFKLYMAIHSETHLLNLLC